MQNDSHSDAPTPTPYDLANPWKLLEKDAKRKAALGTRMKGKCFMANKQGYHAKAGAGPTHIPFPEGFAGSGYPVNRTLTEDADGLLVIVCPGCSRVLRPKKQSHLPSYGVWLVTYPHHYAAGSGGVRKPRGERPSLLPLTDLDLATLLDLGEARLVACGPKSRPLTSINTYDLVAILRDLVSWRRAAKLIQEQQRKDGAT